MNFRYSFNKLSEKIYAKLNFSSTKITFHTEKYCSSKEWQKPAYNSQRPNHEYVATTLSKFEDSPDNATWDSFRKSIIDNRSLINEQSIDGIVMGYLSTESKLSLAKSYIRYLSASNIQPNIATIGKLVKTYYSYFQQKDVPIEEQEAVLNWCNELIKLGTLDAITADNVIHGLVLTNQWENSLKILDMIKITATPGASTYSVIIEAAFKHGKQEIGWRILNDMISVAKRPKCITYKSWIDYCLKCYETHKNDIKLLSDLEEMLHFIGNNDIYVTKDVAQKYVRAFQSLGWFGRSTTIISQCRCKSCSQTLQPIIITTEEFGRLQKEFLSRVLIRKGIFNRSTPEELINFRNTLSKSAPYDVVVDGLNVAFSTGKKNPHELANIVAAVVKHFLDHGKNVLVLGRKHMRKWPQRPLQFIQRNAHIFLAEDLSFDDPYLLYAAIYSGPETYFVSRDLMRGHRYLLKDDDMQDTFKKWQMSHQYQLECVKPNGETIFKPPLRYLPCAQKNKNCWHIPYIQEYAYNNNLALEPPLHWICLQKKQKM